MIYPHDPQLTAFARTHPEYGWVEANAIAEANRALHIPFCLTCSDWHYHDGLVSPPKTGEPE